jgi:methenyltetrahydrofolate cyclohydrolase
MPPLADRTLAALLSEIAAATPAPGGGSTAAVACALAAALVEMSAGPPLERAAALQARALELADDDLSSFAPVLDAQRLPAGDETRPERLRAALAAASDTPLAIAAVGCELAELAAEVARGGRPSLEGDATAAALLAEAATRAAARLVELNLAGMPDDIRLRTAGGYAARAWAARKEAAAESPAVSRPVED